MAVIIGKAPLLIANAKVVSYPAATVGLPDSLLGRVAVICATLYAEPEGVPLPPLPVQNFKYKDAQSAHDQALRQLDYYNRLADDDDRINLIQQASDLEDVLATWDDDKDISERKQGLLILMEGADPIIEPRQFEEWYGRGVRIVGTAWTQTRYSGGTGAPGGLTRLGFELLEVLASFNAILDLSHMAEQAFMESVDRYEGILIASHSNPRRFRNSDRHLSDEMIRRLAERDGVMGTVLYNRFLKQDWASGDHKSTVPLSIVADVIDHVCQVTGSANHIGIGSDFDGGFGSEAIPAEMNTITDLLLIADVLKERGYSPEDIEKVMGGNWLRKLRECLPE